MPQNPPENSINQPSDSAGLKRVVVLGSTGSIGTQTLSVIEQFPEQLQVVGLSAGNNLPLLASQVAQFEPQWVCIQSAHRVDELKQLLPDFKGAIISGDGGLLTLSQQPDYDTLVVGLVGLTGLAPTLAALEAGKQVLTANKETFVAGGHLVQPYLRQIIPLDSEHSALFQCLGQEPKHHVDRLYLTASGGPFRTWSLAEMATITKAQALKHPNWVMGDKVTIDSATLMNKGLEVIEAHWLFGVPYQQISVVVHPQSIVHSGVAFTDGSVLTQWGQADMRVPIQYGLTYPSRWTTPFPSVKLDLLSLSQLHFEAPDLSKFPCLALAYAAGQQGSVATCALNAADEVAVAAFLKEEIGFMAIATVVENTVSSVMSQMGHFKNENNYADFPLSSVMAVDALARQITTAEVSRKRLSVV